MPKKDIDLIHVWLGCTSRSFLKGSVKNLNKILKKMDVNYEIIDDTDVCCGSVLFVTGQNNAAMDNLKDIEKILIQKKVQHLISLCPGCTRTFKNYYKPRKNNPIEKVEHYTEVILNNIEKLNFNDIGKFKVTYHDPCHLARHMEIIEQPREVIKALPGVSFVELPTNKNDAFCCGSGGGMRSYNKELADNTSLLRLLEGKEVGVEILLTSCPFCERSLQMALDLPGAPKQLKVINLVDFLPDFL